MNRPEICILSFWCLICSFAAGCFTSVTPTAWNETNGPLAVDRMSTIAATNATVTAASQLDGEFNVTAWEAGGFGGFCAYYKVQCKSADKCHWLVEEFIGIPLKDFQAWRPPTYRETIRGPFDGTFQSKSGVGWSAGEIREGKVYEQVVLSESQRDLRPGWDRVQQILVVIVDEQQNIVYVHHEVGSGTLQKSK